MKAVYCKSHSADRSN